MRTRADRDQQRLDSGAVSSAKDLENLQHELESLAKRQGDLEDVVLEVMERLESAETRVTEMTARRDDVQHSAAEAEARRDAATAEIDAEAAKVTRERETVAVVIPADLLKLYDRLRQTQGGVGAARLFQRRCEGCRVELSITELREVKCGSPRHRAALRELPSDPGPHGGLRPVARQYGNRRRGSGSEGRRRHEHPTVHRRGRRRLPGQPGARRVRRDRA